MWHLDKNITVKAWNSYIKIMIPRKIERYITHRIHKKFTNN